MRTDLIIAGVGGQGSIMAGTLLGTAAVVYDNKKALQTQAYSSELRGGAAVTWVIVSDEAIIRVEVKFQDEDVVFTADGQVGMPLQEGDVVEMRKSRSSTLLVKSPSKDFFEVLRTKLYWGAR